MSETGVLSKSSPPLLLNVPRGWYEEGVYESEGVEGSVGPCKGEGGIDEEL